MNCGSFFARLKTSGRSFKGLRANVYFNIQHWAADNRLSRSGYAQNKQVPPLSGSDWLITGILRTDWPIETADTLQRN